MMIDRQTITEQDIWQALRDVPDPEIPTINLVDLGVILRVELDKAAQHARILLMPTFTGCPAIEFMRDLIRERLAQLGLVTQVDVTREQRWSSDRISEAGRRALAKAGIAPPGPATSSVVIPLLEPALCPHCGSRHTTLDSAFGPTLCRAIAYCRDCKQPFEQFKPL
ncbi:MAG TPA: 1,2-phenylacetyl-CoA epoxidase subunit PaaD [Roseiflexaceae bacterium]|nr:1,2-phenylacetyl-CoA epoxidase subunit PaaD [Roseiflexaceae bacterium]